MSIFETSAISVELPAPTSVLLMLTSGRSIWIWQQPVAAGDPSRPWSPWPDPGPMALVARSPPARYEPPGGREEVSARHVAVDRGEQGQHAVLGRGQLPLPATKARAAARSTVRSSAET